MGRRRTSVDAESTRLLNHWTPDPDAGAAVGCIATTFTFGASHFEEQCLARFISMETDPAENTRAYLIEREEKLSQVFACVIVDQRHAQNQRSLRWHLLPVRLPAPGIQHAKLSLLLWEQRLRIVISSANLTAAGYRTNRELAAVLEFSPEGGAPLTLARECLDFLATLSQFAPGRDDAPGPRRALTAFLADARHRINRWPDSSARSGSPRLSLLPVLPTASGRTRSVPAQLKELWRGPAPANLTVLSPFFDQADTAIDHTYSELERLLTNRGVRNIEFRTSGRTLADGQIEMDIPKRLADSPKRHDYCNHILKFIEPMSHAERDALRPLHGKALVLEHPEFRVFMLGSSNCTVAGLGLSATPNAEINLAYALPGFAGTFWKQCLSALPGAKEVLDPEDVSFTATTDTSADEPAPLALLPDGFVEALFRPSPDGGDLELELEPPSLPELFEVLLPDGRTMLDATAWATTFERAARVSIAAPRAVGSLTVKWQDGKGTWQSAPWVVNVTDTAPLAPPDELRNLSLEDLLAVLTSARPIHWALDERLAARCEAGSTATPIVDPLKKVDTSQFLMRRMRRLARALEGLRARMELPVSSVEGLRWRLHGPLGPIALGRALQAEAGAGGPFFIAEVTTTLQDIRWQLGGAIKQDALATELASAQRELKSLALEHASDTPENLRTYVADELARIPA